MRAGRAAAVSIGVTPGGARTMTRGLAHSMPFLANSSRIRLSTSRRKMNCRRPGKTECRSGHALSLAPRVSATTQTPLSQRPDVTSNVSFDKLIVNLNGIPAMGSAELRDGR